MSEYDAFSDQEKNKISEKTGLLNRWLTCVEISFRKHYEIPKSLLDENTLGVTNNAKLKALNDVLNEELKTIIEIRNSIAHGEWIYPFNNQETKVNDKKYHSIHKDNLLTLQFKYQLVDHLVNTVHDLVVSRPTFERDFEYHFQKLIQVRTNIKKRKYEKYKNTLIKKKGKARIKNKQDR